ncbi:flagellar biosynthesis protein FliS [Bacillus coahuilensis p1.1.43]|uniref:Flagellar secretion chaperone FliS n=1 Tax=Bacillus coahuilensis p1.1.43 TaxID=1150625 RepID=A0A147K639_9BACI|nr:flagellar export chaperone FliS [Bacillus coahuilensis]KUP05251.1 flagellar biosynthesis protein FliS [Bacillus coahuilensis p1.1.43]
MAIKNPYQAYQNNSVNTASPGELTLMLYNGCLKFLHLGKKAIEEGNIQEKNINIQKAQNIIQEFMVTLNMDIPMSKNLQSLYDYMYRQLISANVKSDAAIIDEVEGMIVELRDTWKQVIQLHRQQQHGSVQGGQV